MNKFRRSKGEKGLFAWTIGLSKAYDRLSWKFLEDTLNEIGFDRKTTKLIMNCVRSVTYSVLVNGETTESIKPNCGLRQGDPISPYLFVICIEKLSQIITYRVNTGEWKEVKFVKQGPTISHVLFADDIILFLEASQKQAHIMRECIEIFCKLSGQKINYEKSMVYCSHNVDRHVDTDIVSICGSSLTCNLGTYLGVPIIHSRIVKGTYRCIVDKMQKRLSSWRGRNLSLAGRLVLIKSVLSTIPIYAMNTVKLPAAVCGKIDKINHNFLWSGSKNNNATYLTNWDTVCKKKEKCGLGSKQARPMNMALLTKLSWRVKEEQNSLWVRTIRSKYPTDIIRGHSDSSTWKGVLAGAKIRNEGTIRRIGNGQTILL